MTAGEVLSGYTFRQPCGDFRGVFRKMRYKIWQRIRFFLVIMRKLCYTINICKEKCGDEKLCSMLRVVRKMRIIAGKAKGHKLETIDGLATRPTTDRIKETLFNMISFDLPGCRFLDLFAGSGAIGMEALSRGAEQAVFVENAVPCQDVIARNLAHTKLGEGARALHGSVCRAGQAGGGKRRV